jgi:hypothetical protein
MFDFRDGFVDIFYTIPLTVSDQHSRSDMRGYVEVYMLWLGKFSFSLPKIESGREISSWDFTEIHLQDTIPDSGGDYSKYYSLGFQEWRMWSRHEGQTVMIKVAQRHHGGFFLRLAWNPGITWFDSLATGTDGRVSFYYQELIYIVHWTGFLGG